MENNEEIAINMELFGEAVIIENKKTVNEEDSQMYQKMYNVLSFLKKDTLSILQQYLSKNYKNIRYNTISGMIELYTSKNEVLHLDDRIVNNIFIDIKNETYLNVKKKIDEDYNENLLEQLTEIRTDENKQFSEEDYESLYLNILKKYEVKNFGIQIQILRTFLESDIISVPYNPIIEIFEEIKDLSNIDTNLSELDKFLKCISFDNSDEIVKMYWKSWIGGVFRNCLELDKKAYDSILIFKSIQGLGKSEMIEQGLLSIFKKYTSSSYNWDTNKDSLMILTQYMFAFDDELSATTKAKNEDIKKITSMRDINGIRRAYGKFTENLKRISSFIGATNAETVVNDTTGSRRFLILNLKSIDNVEIKKIDYKLLWSQCYNYFYLNNNIEYLHFDKVQDNNTNLTAVNVENEYLSKIFDLGKTDYNCKLTATDILELIHEKGYKTDALKINKIFDCLKKHGYTSKKGRLNGKVVNFFELYKYNEDEGFNVDSLTDNILINKYKNNFN